MNNKLPSTNEILQSLEFRYASLLTLPTRNSNYFETIMECLIYVKDNSPLVIDFGKWFCNQYNVCKNNSYNSRKTLERANLVLVKTDKKLYLTIDGRKCFTDDPMKIISRCFINAYEGMMEILVVLMEKNCYTAKRDLFNTWYKKFNDSFNSIRNYKTCYSQFCIMLNYLIDFNLIKKLPQGKIALKNVNLSYTDLLEINYENSVNYSEAKLK